MQEGIALCALDRIVGCQCGIDVGQRILVFGMLHDPVSRDRFQWRENFIGTLLAKGFAEKAPDVVLRGGEHGLEQMRLQNRVHCTCVSLTFTLR